MVNVAFMQKFHKSRVCLNAKLCFYDSVIANPQYTLFKVVLFVLPLSFCISLQIHSYFHLNVFLYMYYMYVYGHPNASPSHDSSGFQQTQERFVYSMPAFKNYIIHLENYWNKLFQTAPFDLVQRKLLIFISWASLNA